MFISQNTKLFLFLLVLLILLFPRLKRGGDSCPVLGRRYGIMMDAGSTGSRTHVFEFDFRPDGTISLVREVFEQVKPGLSSFKDRPEAAAQSLVPLLKVAKDETPAAIAPCTPIALKATAGLRLLGSDKTNLILSAVADTIRRFPFRADKDVAVVMDGRDEGPYAWITVNFLLGNLGGSGPSAAPATPPTTVAILDMGGASTQIVFKTDSETALENATSQFLYEASILGTKHRVYQNSYLGFGLHEANRQAVLKGVDENFSIKDDFKCLPSGYVFTVEDKTKKKRTIVGKGTSFDGCVEFMSAALIDTNAPCTHAPCSFNGIYQPRLRDSFKGDIYAFSYFYDRMVKWLPANGEITVGKYKEIGLKMCDGNKSSKGTMCMDLAYLYTLLTRGYGLDDTQKLYVKKKIKGIETAWALGAMLTMMK